jgi:hypothetical protein
MLASVRTCARAIRFVSGGRSGYRSGSASSKYSSAARDCVMDSKGPLGASEFGWSVNVGTDFDGLIFVYGAEDWSLESRLI